MNKPELVKYVESLTETKQFPAFKAGDTITVDYTIKEGNKTRTQSYTEPSSRFAEPAPRRLSPFGKFLVTWALNVFSPSVPPISKKLK